MLDTVLGSGDTGRNVRISPFVALMFQYEESKDHQNIRVKRIVCLVLPGNLNQGGENEFCELVGFNKAVRQSLTDKMVLV